MSSLLDIEMFWYASFQLDHDLLIDHRRSSHTRQPDRRIKLSKESAKTLKEEIFYENKDSRRELINNKESHSCSICINEFKNHEVLKVLPCQHTFHSKCIVSWLTNYHACCPLCMVPVIVTSESTK